MFCRQVATLHKFRDEDYAIASVEVDNAWLEEGCPIAFSHKGQKPRIYIRMMADRGVTRTMGVFMGLTGSTFKLPK